MSHLIQICTVRKGVCLGLWHEYLKSEVCYLEIVNRTANSIDLDEIAD